MKRSMAVLLSAIFLWLLTQIPYDIIRQERIRAFGEAVAEATVVKKKVLQEAGNDVFLLTYRYFGPEGLARERTAPFTFKAWQHTGVGRSIRIYYAKGEPNLSRAHGEAENAFRVRLRKMVRGDELPELEGQIGK